MEGWEGGHQWIAPISTVSQNTLGNVNTPMLFSLCIIISDAWTFLTDLYSWVVSSDERFLTCKSYGIRFRRELQVRVKRCRSFNKIVWHELWLKSQKIYDFVFFVNQMKLWFMGYKLKWWKLSYEWPVMIWSCVLKLRVKPWLTLSSSLMSLCYDSSSVACDELRAMLSS